MTIEQVKEVACAQKGAWEDFPFGPDVLVIKVKSKMFALLNDQQISLKCEPMLAELWRQTYPQVTAGYHLNKRHWNTVAIEGMEDEVLRQMVDHSYQLVVKSLSKAERASI